MKYALVLIVVMSLMSCGRQGPAGAPGQDAVACTTHAIPGGVAITCPDGSTQNVYNGVQGPAGPDGSPGAPGAPGSPGSVVAAIKFCPGYATSYPAVFPEFGFCVDSELYGVYWDGHNAWWTYIAPGYYASTSTSAACNFTVGLNCEITQQ